MSEHLRALVLQMDALWTQVLAEVDSLSTPTNIIRVRSGEDLQAALDRAVPGDTVRIEPATYRGSFLLRRKQGTGIIQVEADVDPRNFNSTRPWVLPDSAPAMVRLESPDTFQPMLRTEPGTSGWSFRGFDFPPMNRSRDQVILGTAEQTTLDEMPHSFVFDQCYFHGDPTPGIGQHRGIAAQCRNLAVRRSYFKDFFEVGRDAQCICSWNGSGQFLIENNYLEGAAENILFGGSPAAIPDLVITDVRVLGNHFTKDPVWWTHPTRPVEKNLFEIKNAQQVLVEGNLFEQVRKAGQGGYALMLTPSGQDGRNPWVTCADLTVRHNLFRKCGGLFNVNNGQAGVTQGTHRVAITHNLCLDMNTPEYWGEAGRMMLVGGGPEDLTVDHNTVLSRVGSGTFCYAYADPAQHKVRNFNFTNNIVREGYYGFFGQSTPGTGEPSYLAYANGGQFAGNVIEATAGRSIRYGSANTRIAAGTLEGQLANYAPVEGSVLAGVVTTDGRPVGADAAAVLTRVQSLLT